MVKKNKPLWQILEPAGKKLEDEKAKELAQKLKI